MILTFASLSFSNCLIAAVYAAFSGFGVYRSLDAGVSWSPMNEGFTTRSGHYPMISSFLAVGDRLWAAEREAIYLNDGARWIMKSRAMGNVLAKGDGFIYHGSDVGVSSTTDSGASWFSINRGLTAHRVGALAWFAKNWKALLAALTILAAGFAY